MAKGHKVSKGQNGDVNLIFSDAKSQTLLTKLTLPKVPDIFEMKEKEVLAEK